MEECAIFFLDILFFKILICLFAFIEINWGGVEEREFEVLWKLVCLRLFVNRLERLGRNCS